MQSGAALSPADCGSASPKLNNLLSQTDDSTVPSLSLTIPDQPTSGLTECAQADRECSQRTRDALHVNTLGFAVCGVVHLITEAGRVRLSHGELYTIILHKPATQKGVRTKTWFPSSVSCETSTWIELSLEASQR